MRDHLFYSSTIAFASMRTSRLVVVSLAIAILAGCDVGNWSSSSVTADEMTCVSGNASNCVKWTSYAELTVTVNQIANSCAMMFNYGGSMRAIEQGGALAFIDKDNWVCKGKLDDTKMQRVASLSDGNIKLTSDFLGDNFGFSTPSNLARTDTVTGRMKHYWRVLSALMDERNAKVNSVENITKPASEPVGLSNSSVKKMPGDELMGDSVRTAITTAENGDAAPIPTFPDSQSRLAYLRWLGATSEKLKSIKPEWNVRKEFLQTVWYESRRAGLDPTLVIGLIEKASDFRGFNVSETGSRGYMAVSPRWAEKLGDGDTQKLFHLQTNLRFGCVLLRHYLDLRKGDLYFALGDYYTDNIAIQGKPQLQAEFIRGVLANEVKWTHQDAAPVGAASSAK